MVFFGVTCPSVHLLLVKRGKGKLAFFCCGNDTRHRVFVFGCVARACCSSWMRCAATTEVHVDAEVTLVRGMNLLNYHLSETFDPFHNVCPFSPRSSSNKLKCGRIPTHHCGHDQRCGVVVTPLPSCCPLKTAAPSAAEPHRP